MKNKGILCAVLLSAAMMTCGTVWAEEQETQPAAVQTYVYQTKDGVLSVEAPDEQWRVTEDPAKWFVMSDGESTITIEHLANGETLPASAAAAGEKAAYCQAFVSTKNEVFVIEGSSAKQENLEEILKIMGTVKILKYDTKTAVSQPAASQTAAPASQNTASSDSTSISAINATYYCTTDGLNVRSGSSKDAEAVGSLGYGESVTVIGAVLQDGQDTGWYQISYNGTTAYASSAYLSETKPAEETSSQDTSSQGTSGGSDEYFLVYGWDGISTAIHWVEGAMYEDMEGRSYADSGDGVFYCIETDSYFGNDPSVWTTGALAGQGMDYSNVNIEG